MATPISDKDPLSAREIAQLISLGIKIQRRQAKGKPTRALENRANRIIELADEREELKATRRERDRRAAAVKKYG